MTETYSPVIAQTLAHLDDFTEEELFHLNRLIVERIRLMHQVKAHRAMTQFRVGQRVQFTTPAGKLVIGVLTKYNRKSVGVLTDQGVRWTVAPGLLRPVS